MSKRKKDDLEQYKDITVANMNVEGMPWYRKDAESDSASGVNKRRQEELTPKETRNLMVNALLAMLLVGGIFFLGMFLFILFCVYVWL